MKLPNLENAEVAESKIRDYLLNEAHSSNRGKAKFFVSFGFTLETWELLALALREHVATHEVTQSTSTEHGTKYIIEGTLVTPDERNPHVRSVWIVEAEDNVPKLVTAYRLRRKQG